MSLDEPQSSSAQIGQDMDKTRDSITEKVAALETQVLGTFQAAADTVTGTVDAVKDAVTTTPLAIRDTLRDVVDDVKSAVGSFSLNGLIRSHPVAALSSSILAGVTVGLLTGGSRRKSTTRPVEVPRQPANGEATTPAGATGLFGEVMDRLGHEARQLAGHFLGAGIARLKKTFESDTAEIPVRESPDSPASA